MISFFNRVITIRSSENKSPIKFFGLWSLAKPGFCHGIMGPFAYVHFTECYYGIVKMDHIVQGKLEIDEATVDFSNG